MKNIKFCHVQSSWGFLLLLGELWGKTEIPGGFFDGCAIAVQSKQEIWLIGGTGTENRILRFNINDHTFQELPSRLNVERPVYSCAFVPHTNKIMISGGHDES